MAKYTIALLAADSLAQSLLDLGYEVLEHLKPDLECVTGDIGRECWKRDGTSVPERTLELVKQSDCAMVITTTNRRALIDTKDAHTSESGSGEAIPYKDPWTYLARELYLYTEMRPCRSYPGNPLNRTESMDLVIFRDLLEGSGTGVGFCPLTADCEKIIASHPDGKNLTIYPSEDVALNTRITSRLGYENVMRQAFEFIRRNQRKKLTVADQTTVFPETSEVIIQTAREVALSYPAISYQELPLFTVISDIISHPDDYDVIVTENLFGDILSRIAIEQVGGTSFLCRVAVGDDNVLVGPVLEVDEDDVDSSQINPFGTLMTARMLMEFLGDAPTASVLEKAMEQVILEGKVVTPDMNGANSSRDVAKAVIEKAQMYLELL